MKKILFPVLILGILLGMSNCDNEETDSGINTEPEDLFSGDNPFIGTWESDIRDTGDQIKLIFSDIAIEMYCKNETMSEYKKYPEFPDGLFLYFYTDNILNVLSLTDNSDNYIEKYYNNFEENKVLNFFYEEYKFKKISKSYKLALGDDFYIDRLTNYESMYGELK
jgi:hypothetical protein